MNTGEQFGLNTATIGVVAVAGLLFGTGYALLIAHLRRIGRLDGYTAVAVVVGTLVTLGLASVLIGIVNTLLVIFAFICTGSPMVLGDMWSHTSKRKRVDDETREALGIGGDNDQA